MLLIGGGEWRVEIAHRLHDLDVHTRLEQVIDEVGALATDYTFDRDGHRLSGIWRTAKRVTAVDQFSVYIEAQRSVLAGKILIVDQQAVRHFKGYRNGVMGF